MEHSLLIFGFIPSYVQRSARCPLRCVVSYRWDCAYVKGMGKQPPDCIPEQTEDSCAFLLPACRVPKCEAADDCACDQTTKTCPCWLHAPNRSTTTRNKKRTEKKTHDKRVRTQGQTNSIHASKQVAMATMGRCTAMNKKQSKQSATEMVWRRVCLCTFFFFKMPLHYPAKEKPQRTGHYCRHA